MRRNAIKLMILLSCTACNGIQKKHENTVLTAAPRRISPMDTEDSEKIQLADASSTDEVGVSDDDETQKRIESVAAVVSDPWATWKDDTAIFNSKVAATVNGAPILNGDVLDRYAGVIITTRDQMQNLWSHPEKLQRGQRKPIPEDFERFRDMLVKRDLSGHIQRRLLVERMKSSLKPDQIKAMDGHINQLFDQEIANLKREMKVSTRTELELELNKKGTTLQNVKDNFATERLAMEYIVLKSEKPAPLNRIDLVNYYKEHLDDYAVPAQVKWDQIQVSFGPERSKIAAKKRIEEALQELEDEIPFGQVAKEYSDGLTAKSGGQRDWMESGNLTDTVLEQKLFDMPLGETSSIHEGPAEWQIVRVTERQTEGRTPFGKVQEQIRKKLLETQNKNRPKKLFDQLFAEAVIETKYDLPVP